METHYAKIEAFKGLMAVQSLPMDGIQALTTAKNLSKTLLYSIRPLPVVTQMLQQCRSSKLSVKYRFIDVSTGMRLRYAEWRGGKDVVLLLHGMGESCEVWGPCAEKLQQRGYRVFALDLRGHGESQWSSGGRYSLDLLAEDIQAFILEKDLYTRPLAVVGCGLGGAVGLTLAQQSPHLVGAALVAEWGVPAAVQAAWQAAQQLGREVSTTEQGGRHNQTVGGGADAPAHLQRAGAVRAAAPYDTAAPGSMGSEAGCAAAPTLDQGNRDSKQAGVAAAGMGREKILPGGRVMPWCCFSPVQGCRFFSLEECVALLCHPLMNVGPEALLPLTQAAAAVIPAAPEPHCDREGGAPPCDSPSKEKMPLGGRSIGEASTQQGGGRMGEGQSGSGRISAQQAYHGKTLQEVLQSLHRPLAGAVRSALAVVRAGMEGGYGGGCGGEGQGLSPRMDPQFFLSFDAATVLSRMATLRCHLLVLRGGASSWVGAEDAASFAALAAGAAHTASVTTIPSANHNLVTDHEEEFLDEVINFLEGPAIACFETQECSTHGMAAGRRPELLDLKPLPQYKSLEEARKALGPRSIPTPAAVEEELRKLRIEEGGTPSDDEDENRPNSYQTALAKDPPDYFGFIG